LTVEFATSGRDFLPRRALRNTKGRKAGEKIKFKGERLKNKPSAPLGVRAGLHP